MIEEGAIAIHIMMQTGHEGDRLSDLCTTVGTTVTERAEEDIDKEIVLAFPIEEGIVMTFVGKEIVRGNLGATGLTRGTITRAGIGPPTGVSRISIDSVQPSREAIKLNLGAHLPPKAILFLPAEWTK